jgi:alkyl sulfatase BDS1-like metallo-beta-lactamase superfamily hydrolase
MVSLLPLEKFLEFLAIRVHGERAQSLRARFNWILVDDDGSQQLQRLTLSHGALSHLPGLHEGPVDATVVTPRGQLVQVLKGPDALLAAIDQGALTVEGNLVLFRAFADTLETFDPMFNVVEP